MWTGSFPLGLTALPAFALHSRRRRGEQLHLCVLHMPGIFSESSSSVGKYSFIFITCTVLNWSHYISPAPTIEPTYIFTVIWSEIQIKKANEVRGKHTDNAFCTGRVTDLSRSQFQTMAKLYLSTSRSRSLSLCEWMSWMMAATFLPGF